MRTRKKSATFLFLCLLLLCCVVPQCHLLGFTGLSLLGSGIGNAMTITNALGMAMTHSMVQSVFTTFVHGFSMLNTMALSLISGFIMGNIALVAFMMFLMAIVPAEDARSIGGSSIFSRSLLPHYPSASIHNRTRFLSRHKRSFLVNASVPISVDINHDDPFPLPRAVLKQDPDNRIPRFFSRLVQRDPLNCMPLLMCGLSAAKKPNTRTETLNDYAYLMKEIISDAQEDRSDEDSVEDDMMGLRGRRRRPVKWREELVEGRLDREPSFKHGKADKEKDVDDIIDDIQQNEDDQIEDLVLTEMANDPHDLAYALEDLKIRGLKKTMSKMPYESRQEYISKLLGESGEEDEDASVPMEMMGHRPRNEYPPVDSSSVEDEEFYSQERIRGGFPPPPPTPPEPEFGSDEDELFKRNLRVLDKNLAGIHRGRLNMRGKRQLGVSQRGYLLQKRSQVHEADNIYDKTRIGAEIGAATRSARQCRSLFRECPVKTIAGPGSNSNTPFLNRAVNNIRKVLLGPQPENSKQKRVNEIKEVIQQLQPAPINRGGSEVKVVLNIGPTPPDPHRTGFDQGQIYAQPGFPGVQYQIHTSPTPQQSKPTLSNKPYQETTLHKSPIGTPKTTANPPTQTTPKKALTYRHPGSTASTFTKTVAKPLPTVSTPPSVELDSLEFMLRTTMAPDSLEDSTAQDLLFEDSTDLPPNLYEGEEHSVEDLLPTKHPMTKDEYAANLRETFSIFNRFKEAHTNPKTTPTPTAKAKETATTSRAPGVKKTAKKKKSPRPGGKGQKKHGGGGQVVGTRPTVKNSGNKSGGGGSGIENDINKIVGVIKNIFKTPTKRGKGKRKKKPGGDGDSSEESSEEGGQFHPHDHPHHVQTHTTLVAVPHPRVRNQIQYKSSSALITDGVYHLLFANRKTKPLVPDHPVHNSGNFEGPPHFGKHHHAPPHHPHRFRTESNKDNKPPPRDSNEEDRLPPQYSNEGDRPPPQYSNEDDRPPPQYSNEVYRPPPQYSNEEGRPPPPYSNEDGERAPGPPGPILMPGGVHFGGPPDGYDSMEGNSSDSEEIGDVGPTEPQLLFNPFAIANRPNKHRSSAYKRKSKKGKKKVVKSKKVTTTTTTTTAKPTRRILKYKG